MIVPSLNNKKKKKKKKLAKGDVIHRRAALNGEHEGFILPYFGRRKQKFVHMLRTR